LVFSIGSILYIRKIMLDFTVDLELQIAIFGFLIILLALIFSKIASKVVFDG